MNELILFIFALVIVGQRLTIGSVINKRKNKNKTANQARKPTSSGKSEKLSYSDGYVKSKNLVRSEKLPTSNGYSKAKNYSGNEYQNYSGEEGEANEDDEDDEAGESDKNIEAIEALRYEQYRKFKNR